MLEAGNLPGLPTIDTEVINERGDSAVGVDRDVKVFMDQKVVSPCLPNDTKIVDECFFHSDSCIELILGNPRGLILFTRCLADAANPLRLKVSSSMNTAAFAPGEPHEHMQITLKTTNSPVPPAAQGMNTGIFTGTDTFVITAA